MGPRRLPYWLANADSGLIQASWERRHGMLVGVLWLHVPLVPLLAEVTGHGWEHGVVEGFAILACAAMGSVRHRHRTENAGWVGIGLLLASTMVVHLFSGQAWTHLHFVGSAFLLLLYRNWSIPTLAAIVSIAQTIVIGPNDPHSVYGHAGDAVMVLYVVGLQLVTVAFGFAYLFWLGRIQTGAYLHNPSGLAA